MPSVLDRFRLDDKVAVVTGASSGLGVAFAIAFAEAGADPVLAARRGAVSPTVPYSLSPPSFANAPPGVRVVVPSPNGATISVEAAALGSMVIAGCLRNAAAVARAARAFGRRVSVIAAGERWPNGALRPAFEDLVGAGAILTGLARSRSAPTFTSSVALSRRSATGTSTSVMPISSP